MAYDVATARALEGQTFTVERQHTLAAGIYRDPTTADVARAVAESDETNNVKTDDYTVTAVPPGCTRI